MYIIDSVFYFEKTGRKDERKSKAKASTCLADHPLGDSIDPSEINVFCLRASKLWERLQPDGVLRVMGEALSFLRSKEEWPGK